MKKAIEVLDKILAELKILRGTLEDVEAKIESESESAFQKVVKDCLRTTGWPEEADWPWEDIEEKWVGFLAFSRKLRKAVLDEAMNAAHHKLTYGT